MELKSRYLHVQQHAEFVAVVQYSQYKIQPWANQLTSAKRKNP